MVKRLLLSAALAIPAIAGMPQPAFAQRCATDLLDCYGRAAKIDNFWYRTAAGLDCELDFAECVRVKLFGS